MECYLRWYFRESEAAKLAEKQKFQDFEMLCTNYEFFPFAVETVRNGYEIY